MAHSKYGWQRGKWWQVDSQHFQIATDAGQQAGVELAERLEEFHAVWRQLFFEYWSSRAWLADRFTGTPSPAPAKRKHLVVFFRDREEYVRQLSAAEPKIAVTLGYYMKGNQTSYFYAGDENAWTVWYHEAAHQLFQETGDPIRDVGEKWNFWVVEGIAVYLESAVKHEGYFTLGGFDADRLQFVRSRVMGGDKSIPFDELSALGREALQRHAEIGRLYTQAAGITHFLMDDHDGRNRDEFATQAHGDVRGARYSPNVSEISQLFRRDSRPGITRLLEGVHRGLAVSRSERTSAAICRSRARSSMTNRSSFSPGVTVLNGLTWLTHPLPTPESRISDRYRV